MKTPDDHVGISRQPPGRGPAGGATTQPLGGRPHPAAREDPQRPDSSPLPRDPDDHVRGR
jgi:hypothetical protein